jgi:hypothetical protein
MPDSVLQWNAFDQDDRRGRSWWPRGWPDRPAQSNAEAPPPRLSSQGSWVPSPLLEVYFRFVEPSTSPGNCQVPNEILSINAVDSTEQQLPPSSLALTVERNRH